jgi:hypothetical protein
VSAVLDLSRLREYRALENKPAVYGVLAPKGEKRSQSTLR